MQSQINGFQITLNAEPNINMIAYRNDNVNSVTLVGWIVSFYISVSKPSDRPS